MPARVDYASRYEFFRQACFALVRDRGVEALTRRTLATQLGCAVNTVRRLVDPGVDLAVLAADEVVTRRRLGRWGRRSEDPVLRAGYLMRRLLPEDVSHIDEELVWMKLVAAAQVGSRSGEALGQVRHDFQVALRGWADDEMEGAESEDAADALADAPTGGRGDARAVALTRHVEARRSEIDSTITTVLELLEVADRDAEALRLEALVHGLTTAVCTGRITPDLALDAMDRHLAELKEGAARVAG